MESKLARWCDSLLEISWLAAIIVIPLFFNVHSDRVFEPDKLMLLRSIALLMSAAWGVQFIERRGWQQVQWGWQDANSIWRKPFALPVIALVIVYLLSTAVSINPRISLLGSYQRLQGTYTTFSYIIIFAIMLGNIKARAQVRRVVTAVIITHASFSSRHQNDAPNPIKANNAIGQMGDHAPTPTSTSQTAVLDKM